MRSSSCSAWAGASAGCGAQDRINQVQLLTMSAVDFLDQWFETDVLKATMSASGIIGTFLGVRSPGTAYVLLHHYMGEIDGSFRSWGLSRGGTGAVSNAIGDAARRFGAEIRTRRAVTKILTKNGGPPVWCSRTATSCMPTSVVSSVDPRLHVRATGSTRRICRPSSSTACSRYKFRGSSGKVNLALDGLPDFTCLPGPGPHLRGAISISPSVDYMERAYDDAKYGRFSRRPYIDIVIPSLTDHVAGAAREARDVVLRAIRAVRFRWNRWEPGADGGREPCSRACTNGIGSERRLATR